MRYSSQVKPVSYLKVNAAGTLALLKILALGNQEVEAGKIRPVAKVAAQLRASRVSD